jgi:hypothetical protein
MNSKILKNTIEILKAMDINGEAMEQLIRDLGMEDQMLRQLIMKADIDNVKELVEEKEQFEEPDHAIYNVTETKLFTINMWFKGSEYVVKAEILDNGSKIIDIYDCDDKVVYIEDHKHMLEFWDIVQSVIKQH